MKKVEIWATGQFDVYEDGLYWRASFNGLGDAIEYITYKAGNLDVVDSNTGEVIAHAESGD